MKGSRLSIMLITSNNAGIKRILDLLSENSLLLLTKKLNNHSGVIKTPFSIQIKKLSLICTFISSNTAVVIAFKYNKPHYNYGGISEIAEINVIENHFLDNDLEF